MAYLDPYKRQAMVTPNVYRFNHLKYITKPIDDDFDTYPAARKKRVGRRAQKALYSVMHDKEKTKKEAAKDPDLAIIVDSLDFKAKLSTAEEEDGWTIDSLKVMNVKLTPRNHAFIDELAKSTNQSFAYVLNRLVEAAKYGAPYEIRPNVDGEMAKTLEILFKQRAMDKSKEVMFERREAMREARKARRERRKKLAEQTGTPLPDEPPIQDS